MVFRTKISPPVNSVCVGACFIRGTCQLCHSTPTGTRREVNRTLVLWVCVCGFLFVSFCSVLSGALWETPVGGRLVYLV